MCALDPLTILNSYQNFDISYYYCMVFVKGVLRELRYFPRISLFLLDFLGFCAAQHQ